LESSVTGQDPPLGDMVKFLALLSKYTDIQELLPALTNEFIDRIIVHGPEKARGNRTLEV